ncbi:AraC family transcriptional regulator [Shimia sp. SDUM112013]|uniref:AraC family transcriptional regulator n=1 Tax=Shimia sp. SDUM112013 TaxID=3136160 RepID=UPI0032ECD696
MGFLDPFRAANYLDGRTCYKWTLASPEGGLCTASNGVTLQTRPMSEVQNLSFDIVIVSSSWTPETHNTPSMQAALWRWARQGRTLGALDTGAFILARAGLLKDRRATVHHEHIDALIEMYPDVVPSEELFVFDGPGSPAVVVLRRLISHCTSFWGYTGIRLPMRPRAMCFIRASGPLVPCKAQVTWNLWGNLHQTV